ncbi:MAG: hypothetical protein GY944_11790 [bacterium]|nr:hypothetical protein [bacterium]
MKQILQSYRSGELWLAEVPVPSVGEHGVLVQTAHSLVSAGTELAKKSLLGNTERPVTAQLGTNTIVGRDPVQILAGFQAARTRSNSGQVPPLWGGRSAGQIVEVLIDRLGDARRI